MKKSGILNAQLIRCIAELGHKDLFMIGDAGMPIPKGVEIVENRKYSSNWFWWDTKIYNCFILFKW